MDEVENIAEKVAAKVIAELRENPLPPRKFVNHAEAAEYLRKGQRTLDTLVASGEGPPVYRGGRGMRLYKISDLDAWVEAQKAA